MLRVSNHYHSIGDGAFDGSEDNDDGGDDGIGDGAGAGDDDGIGDGGDILKLLSGGRLACQMDEDSTALLLAFAMMMMTIVLR